VIPYVKVGYGYGKFTWSRSNCAAAVASECVYFLVLLTVPKDINPVWYKYASPSTLPSPRAVLWALEAPLECEVGAGGRAVQMIALSVLAFRHVRYHYIAALR